MTFIVKDRVQETCNSPGTGTVSLLGALTGFQTFSSAIGNTNTTFYTIADQVGGNWEVGVGTYSSSGDTLTRTTVLASSNGGSLTNFASGTQNVWCDYAAGKAILLDPAGKLNVGGNGYVDYASASPTVAAGRMWYDGTTGAWNLGMGGGNITQQVGEELFVYGKASAAISGNTLLQAIYQTGTVGASGVIQFGPTVSGITNGQLIIGVATEDLALNAFGRITSFGIVHGVDTSGSTYSQTWANGDAIWYNPTTGGLTNVKPVAPNLKVQLGTVIKAGTGGSGSFFVEVDHGSVLGGTDSNVQITSPATGNLLQYNGTYWTNIALPTNGVTVTSQTATAGQTVFTTTYTVGQLWVYRNGVLLNSADYTASNGTSVTLGVGATVGDTVTFAAFSPFTLISATGTGNAVLQTSPTINAPTLTNPIITGSNPQVTTYSSGSGTYTTPANARFLIVEMVGGGGGGSGGGTASWGAGGNGGSTTFGSNSCNGGAGGQIGWYSVGGSGGTISAPTGIPLAAVTGAYGGGNTFVYAGNAGIATLGGSGGSSPFGGAGPGSSYVGSGGAAQGGTGSGGGGGGGGTATTYVYTGGGGGSGGYIKAYISSPASTYAYSVGAGGTAGAAGSGVNAAPGGAGGNGWLSITAYF